MSRTHLTDHYIDSHFYYMHVKNTFNWSLHNSHFNYMHVKNTFKFIQSFHLCTICMLSYVSSWWGPTVVCKVFRSTSVTKMTCLQNIKTKLSSSATNLLQFTMSVSPRIPPTLISDLQKCILSYSCEIQLNFVRTYTYTNYGWLYLVLDRSRKV